MEARYNVASDVAEFLCLDLCFISSLLTAGFHLDENVRFHGGYEKNINSQLFILFSIIQKKTPIVLAKSMKFNGARVETQWSLGASIAEVSETRQALGMPA